MRRSNRRHQGKGLGQPAPKRDKKPCGGEKENKDVFGSSDGGHGFPIKSRMLPPWADSIPEQLLHRDGWQRANVIGRCDEQDQALNLALTAGADPGRRIVTLFLLLMASFLLSLRR